MVQAENIAVTGHGQNASLSPSVAKVARILVNTMLTTSLLMASLVFASGSLPAMFGLKTMVVTSGSMEPTIRVGDAVGIRRVAPESLRIGDVITFTPYGTRGLVTHRVKAIKDIQGATYFQTQGDANATPDHNLSSAGAVYGKVVLTLPKGGYLLHFAATTWGKLFIIGLPLLIIMSKEAWGLIGTRKPRRQVMEYPALYQAESNETPMAD